MHAASRSSGISLRRGKSMVRPHGGRRQSAIPRSLFSRPIRTQAYWPLRAKIKSRTPHVRRISKARVYKLASIGTLLRNSGAAGVRSEFHHAQVRLLDSKISNGVRIQQGPPRTERVMFVTVPARSSHRRYAVRQEDRRLTRHVA